MLSMRETTRVGWDLLPQAIQAAADWLRTEQPPNALGSHLGELTHLGDGLWVSVAGNGWHGGQGGERGDSESALLNVKVTRANTGMNYQNFPEPIPFTTAELAEVRAMIEATGLTIVAVWGNGVGVEPEESNGTEPMSEDWRSYGVLVSGGKPESLRQMYRNYDRECPEHGGHGRFVDNCPEDCEWNVWSYDARVEPAWPWVDRPEAASGAPEQPDDDRNLEAVKAALEKLAPLVPELGIHPATMTAGHRGRIEGEAGDLRFQEEQGHGVQFPAEAAMELVRLALIGREVEG